jgi:brefeldin A-inhibited guanine nucleotide-exchange protein 3
MGGSNSIAVMLGGESKRDHNRERDTICLSLDGLRRAARLSCTLGIQTRCELVLALLANASCGVEGSAGKRARQQLPSGPVKLHAAQVLSMDGLLAVGVELGSHAPKCWKHVFR